jgi:hypothetical protein
MIQVYQNNKYLCAVNSAQSIRNLREYKEQPKTITIKRDRIPF